ncbi:hypothetical protein D3C78_1931170 [compost metagenome]
MNFTRERHGFAVGHVLLKRDFLQMDETVRERAPPDDPDARVLVFRHRWSLIGKGWKAVAADRQ